MHLLEMFGCLYDPQFPQSASQFGCEWFIVWASAELEFAKQWLQQIIRHTDKVWPLTLHSQHSTIEWFPVPSIEQ